MTEKICFKDDVEGDRLLGYLILNSGEAIEKVMQAEGFDPMILEISLTLNGVELPVLDTW